MRKLKLKTEVDKLREFAVATYGEEITKMTAAELVNFALELLDDEDTPEARARRRKRFMDELLDRR